MDDNLPTADLIRPLSLPGAELIRPQFLSPEQYACKMEADYHTKEQADRKAEESKVDEELWQACLSAIPENEPAEVPEEIGRIGNLKVILVDGDKVKIDNDMEFCEGGNHGRFDFIPSDEIWLDDNIKWHDLVFVLYHEAHERRLIMDKGLNYDAAHDRSNPPERELRIRARNAKEQKALSFYSESNAGGLVHPAEQKPVGILMNPEPISKNIRRKYRKRNYRERMLA